MVLIIVLLVMWLLFSLSVMSIFVKLSQMVVYPPIFLMSRKTIMVSTILLPSSVSLLTFSMLLICVSLYPLIRNLMVMLSNHRVNSRQTPLRGRLLSKLDEYIKSDSLCRLDIV